MEEVKEQPQRRLNTSIGDPAPSSRIVKKDSAEGMKGTNDPTDLQYIVERLTNLTNSAEGPILPPRLMAGRRVPLVRNLRVAKSEAYFGGTQITLTWTDPPYEEARNVAGYNVYVQGLINKNIPPIGPYFTRRSPAVVQLKANDDSRVVLTVQTILLNGQYSELSASPSVAASVSAATIDAADIPAGTVPVASIEDGTAGQLITWDASNVVGTIGPGATNNILVGSGAGAVPQFKSRTTLDLVEGRSGLTTAGRVVEVSSSGVVTQSSFASSTVVQGAASLTNANRVTKVTAAGTIGETSFDDSAVVLGAAALTDAGAVPYVTSAGTLTDDPTNLFYDATGKALGVGTNAPAAPLHAVQATLGNSVQALASTATNDDPTENVYQNRVATTNATLTTLHTFTIPASTTYAIEALVIARRTGGASGTAEDGARYKLSAVYKNVAGTATIIGVITTVADEDQAAWNATFTPTAGTVTLDVTGAASNNITWHMTARTYGVSS